MNLSGNCNQGNGNNGKGKAKGKNKDDEDAESLGNAQLVDLDDLLSEVNDQAADVSSGGFV